MISHLCLAAWYLLSSRDSLLLTQRTRFVSSLKPQFCVLDIFMESLILVEDRGRA
ncbi:hypothetical protein HID58_055527 [Brassica napus]|uniref:Uncharacterized protein n=1 Tax=Brassica napus TaxID=3708 RepID=A0ABQ8AL23_BRANA|nr:hypothetical protein HID58_055527 [Brassica napus]